MGQGRLRSSAEIERMLVQAGFSAICRHRTMRPWQCAVLSAVAA
jgi:hypothetical protein